jgi:hypothetical protein
MQFPDEFNALLGQMHIDFFRGRKPEQALTVALIALGRKRREVVRNFLDEMLRGPLDLKEVQRQLWASPADIAPTDASQIPRIFKLMRDLIDSPEVRNSTIP